MNAHANPSPRLTSVLQNNLLHGRGGVFSVCSAHPLAIEAALELAGQRGQIAVIEATSNQVNQDGGYTGMRPADFVALVRDIASKVPHPPAEIVLGGDHLGPQPFRKGDAGTAMHKACEMVADFVRAGFTKIHLDCSMSCADDPVPLPEKEIADRAARLAAAAEKAAAETGASPLYIVGTEVPPPGGMGSGHEIVPTDPEHVRVTWDLHKKAFEALGLKDGFSRVIGMVVQPGLDFGNVEVVDYQPAPARALSASVGDLDGAVFEAHSTDYQKPQAYSQLVAGHFAILKVGPAATFALREALYALELIEAELTPPDLRSGLRDALEEAMLADPSSWSDHYQGDAATLKYLRHFSLSDRLRYYWTEPGVEAAHTRLMTNLGGRELPLPLISQYFPQFVQSIQSGGMSGDAKSLVLGSIMRALEPFADACQTHEPLAE